MKKTIMFKALTLIIAMAASVSIVSCDDDDEVVIPEDPSAIKSITVSYTVDASYDFLAFYDIKANYGLAPSAGTVEYLQFSGWSYTATYDNSVVEFPISMFCNVTAAPKAEIPTIDTEKVYTFKADCSMIVKGLTNDNQTTLLSYQSSTHPSLTMKGDKVQAYLDRGEINVINYSYTVE